MVFINLYGLVAAAFICPTNSISLIIQSNHFADIELGAFLNPTVEVVNPDCGDVVRQ